MITLYKNIELSEKEGDLLKSLDSAIEQVIEDVQPLKNAIWKHVPLHYPLIIESCPYCSSLDSIIVAYENRILGKEFNKALDKISRTRQNL